MKVNSNFSIAVHILLCISRLSGEYKLTSEFIAGSVNTNPVIIRKVLGYLKKAGIVTVVAGTGGAYLARPAEKITLLDIFKAVNTGYDSIFSFHENPNPKCPVGKNIHAVLDVCMDNAQKAMENSLLSVNLKTLSVKIDK